MVENGLRATILPDLVLQKQSYDIAILPVEPMIMRKISIISRNPNELSIAAKTFMQYLIDNQKSLP